MFYRFLGGLSLMLSLCHCTIRPITSEIPEKGVSSELAAFRKKQLAEVHYTLSFDIPEVRKAPIKAELFLDANIRDNSRPLYLDFKADPASLLKWKGNPYTLRKRTPDHPGCGTGGWAQRLSHSIYCRSAFP